MKIYVIADTHFAHKSLAEDFNARPVDFEHRIIRNWRRVISPDDLVVHLGDVVVGKPDDWKSVVPSLPGRKILVLGNHDRKTLSWYMENGIEFCCSQFLWEMYGLNILFSHEPVMNGSFDLNIHGHLHGGNHRECNPDQRHHLISLEKGGYQPRPLESIVKEWRRKANQKIETAGHMQAGHLALG